MASKSKGEVTKDLEFEEYEKKFLTVQKQADTLLADAQAFRDGVAAMLSHQIVFSQSLTPLYQPTMGVPEPEDGINRRRQTQLSHSATKTAEDYEACMQACKDELTPEIDDLDHTVLQPVISLREIMRQITKTITKRHHKMVDYDRFRSNLTKLQSKAEKSISDEKQIFKLETQLETATEDFNFLNDMLKEQLPYFLQLRSHFIDPIFQAFYNLQVKIYLSMWQRIHQVVEENPGHFETVQYGIQDGYQARQQNFNAREVLEQTELLEKSGKSWRGATGTSGKLSLQERAAMKKEGSIAPSISRTQSSSSNGSLPPPSYAASPNYTNQGPPPPLPRKPSSPAGNYVTALYDYNAQADGDLTFAAGDRILVIDRKGPDEWWTGTFNGAQGVFPGNYVESS
ncbi:hypothetical protein INT44_007231 [Umbelopsis vinacea]|uniref:BAR-domain-containing protein n=1 Tax=Umbelopsis vinacea TaxID=44442 RepID=A0A8H7PM89_9FUNG|nr:hypothetical protein INT44_007231 [Umbelopsis vinacea]